MIAFMSEAQFEQIKKRKFKFCYWNCRICFVILRSEVLSYPAFFSLILIFHGARPSA